MTKNHKIQYILQTKLNLMFYIHAKMKINKILSTFPIFKKTILNLSSLMMSKDHFIHMYSHIIIKKINEMDNFLLKCQL